MNGPGHWGVEVVGNEVMLCECDNEGTIMVYDKELKYLICIQHERAGKLRDVSADSHGNLYATDYSNNCIQVFSKDGVFLCSFSCDANGDQKLDVPCGVCVSGQHVYVASCKKNEVVVFTTDGVYTTTLVHNDDEAPKKMVIKMPMMKVMRKMGMKVVITTTIAMKMSTTIVM